MAEYRIALEFRADTREEAEQIQRAVSLIASVEEDDNWVIQVFVEGRVAPAHTQRVRNLFDFRIGVRA
jgi:hypothetical protein